jgi:hypothetical protein
MCLHFAHDLPPMDADRDLTCAKVSSDLFAESTRDDERQNFSLTAGQLGVILLQFGKFCFVSLLPDKSQLNFAGEARLDRAKCPLRGFALFIFLL